MQVFDTTLLNTERFSKFFRCHTLPPGICNKAIIKYLIPHLKRVAKILCEISDVNKATRCKAKAKVKDLCFNQGQPLGQNFWP